MRTVVAGGAVALVVLAVGAGAGIEHTILHGVEVGRVHVEASRVHAGANPDELRGLSPEQLQTSVESQLREAGIEIKSGAPATLFVFVRLVTDPPCYATIESSLVEDALLERNGLRVRARSWGGSASISGHRLDECLQHIPEGVEKTVSGFIEMHGAMNPRAD